MSALSVSAVAGDMETPGYATPPPDHMSQSASTDATAANSCSTPEPCENTTDAADELLYNVVKALIGFF